VSEKAGKWAKKWVERLRYEGFESEEEARKFLEESDRFFRETLQEIWNWHRKMTESFHQLFDDLREPFFQLEPRPSHYLEKANDVYERLEKLDGDVDQLKKDMKEVKELLLSKYVKKKRAVA